MIGGLHSDADVIAATICDKASFLELRCAHADAAPAARGAVLMRGVPPGVYAVQAFHDENSNGRIDMSIFGRPREGIGFSRDAPMHFSPPDFRDATVRLEESNARLNLAIRDP